MIDEDEGLISSLYPRKLDKWLDLRSFSTFCKLSRLRPMRPKSARFKLVVETELNALDSLRVRSRKFAEIELVGSGELDEGNDLMGVLA